MIKFYSFCLFSTIIVSTFIFPEFNRYQVRDVTGLVTLLAGAVGFSLTSYLAFLLNKTKTNLSKVLCEVYLLMSVIFLCTSLFGIFGIIKADLIYWHNVYDIRATAVALEAIALVRFFIIWKNEAYK